MTNDVHQYSYLLQFAGFFFSLHFGRLRDACESVLRISSVQFRHGFKNLTCFIVTAAHPAFRKACSMLVYLFDTSCLFSISSYYMYNRATSEAESEVVHVKLVKAPSNPLLSVPRR